MQECFPCMHERVSVSEDFGSSDVSAMNDSIKYAPDSVLNEWFFQSYAVPPMAEWQLHN